MNRISLFLVALMFLQVCTPLVAFASTPCSKTYPLNIGEYSPCSGILWPKTWTAEALTCVNVTVPSFKAELEASESKLKICNNRLLEQRTLCVDKMDKLISISEDAAKLTTEWWESPFVWGAVGFVAGGLFVFNIYESAQR